MEELEATSANPDKLFENATKLLVEDILSGNWTETKNAYEKFDIVLRQEVFPYDVKYLIMAKAIDAQGQPAKMVSNIARFSTSPPPDPEDGISGGEIFGIIVGCLLIGALIGFLILGALVEKGVIERPDIKKLNIKMPKMGKK
jgi:hypothetical protein